MLALVQSFAGRSAEGAREGSPGEEHADNNGYRPQSNPGLSCQSLLLVAVVFASWIG